MLLRICSHDPTNAYIEYNKYMLLKQTLLACKQAFYATGFFSLFINIFVLTVPLYMMQLFDRVLASHSSETLIYLTLIALTTLVIMALLDMARSRVLVHTSSWLDHQLSPIALEKSPDAILQGHQYGPQALRDITTIRQFIASPGIFALFDSPWVPIFLIVIFLLSPVLGLLSVLGAVILFSLAVWNEKATHAPLAEANRKAIKAQQYVDTSLRNAEAIQAMGMMNNVVQHWQKQNEPVLQLQAVASNRAGVIVAISKFVRLSLQLLMLGVGAWLVIDNKLTAGAMMAGSILLARALAPVEQSIGIWKQWLSADESYKRLDKHFAEQARPAQTITLPRPKGNINLENVFYRTPTHEKPILNGVNLQIKAGETIAILGPSGAGKSTLARLIVGAMKPSAGTVRLDGADVYTWDRSAFGKYIGYVPQDVELFSGKVKDNIARMGEVNDSAVITAAQLTGLHDIILHLGQGYDTEITSTGFTLSGGQRQRVALARALYQDPCLIVLDEPDSSLDHEGEQALMRALLAMKSKGATQIIIAHRPFLVQAADKILVLNEGRVQFWGPRDQILAELQKITQQKQNPAS